jgi:D-alanyl-D-alanine carboxypeptidase
MRSTKHLFWLVPVFTLGACLDPAATTDDETSAATTACAADTAESTTGGRFPDAVRRDLQQTLDAVVASGVAPGVGITIHHPAHRGFSASAGVADRNGAVPLTPAHRLRAGSMLKTAVAVAVLQLVERRRLSLDASLTELLPRSTISKVAEAENITVRMLLSHTAGVPEFTGDVFTEAVLDNPTRVWTVDEFLDLSAAQPRPFAPGAGWAYSNTGYILLGEVLEATTGEPWRETVERRVLARAGLTHSSLPRPGNPACRGCSRGYELIAGELIDFTKVDPSMAGAAGGDALITTTGDLVQFLRALRANRLFDRPATLALMQTFVAAPVPEEAQTGYGLGLTLYDVNGAELIGHLGGTAGFQGFMLLDTSTGVVISGHMNRRPGGLGNFILPVLAAVARIP